MSIPERLEFIRKSLGFTQAEMANELDVSLRMYSDYASSVRPLPTPALVKIAGMGFDVNWLLIGQPAKTPGPPGMREGGDSFSP